MGEEPLVSAGCSSSANWVLCLPFALFCSVVTACRKEESGRTVGSEHAEGSAGTTQRGASSEDKHRLFTRDDRHSHEEPVHVSVPPMPARGT